MFRLIAAFAVALIASSAFAHDEANIGWIIKDSTHSVAETVEKLVGIIENAPPKIFAVIDHAAGAKSVDMPIPDATLVIFGAPAIGTPIIAANPMAALDLPIRVLIWDEGGQTKIGYLDTETLKARYGLEGADDALMGIKKAVGNFTDAAAN